VEAKEEVMRKLVCFHASCADGFTAAWIAHLNFGDNAEYMPVQYGQAPPDVRGRDVFILDFSYKRDVLHEMAASAKSLVVLDHHKTAMADLEGFADDDLSTGHFARPKIVFDMGKSGARLTWDYFFPGKMSPWIVGYTEDRDLWRWQLPESREINAAVWSYFDGSFETWDILGQITDLDPLIQEGRAIERAKAQMIDAICRNAREVEIDGHKILAANTSVLFSEVAGKLAEGRPFGAAWFVRADGKRQWSMRSRDGGVDVSEVARRHGGGGHAAAAGYESEA
jgi:uncharacterized protein